ncbi:MAG: NAD(P)/FAD-dependent oxidoreductase [Acidimicrobiales bacterium]
MANVSGPVVSDGSRPHVVIVGGGFGGLACARALEGWPVRVTLIDARNYHLFTPLLYQVATGLLNPSDIAYPFRSRFRRSPNVRFRQARVARIDQGAKTLHTQEGEAVAYDYLVLATGSTNNYFGDKDLAAFTLGMKSLEEALRLRNHVLSCLEAAAQATDPLEQRRLLTFVVVGGGPTGVEYAGALGELLHLVVGDEFPELDFGLARILVIEGQDRLLAAMAPRLGRYAARTLARRGIEVQTGLLVKKVTPESVVLSDGQSVPTRTVVWSAGVRPDLPEAAEGAMSGRVAVDENFAIAGWPGAFAIGDAAAVEHEGAILPMLSAPAMQGGRHVAAVIRAETQPGDPPPPPFRYKDKGTMATIGRNAAVSQVGRLHLTGFVGWVAWLAVHLYYLVGFRNRAVVLSTWGFNYFHRERPIRIIARADDHLGE